MAPRTKATKTSSPEVLPLDNPIDTLEELVLKCLEPKAIGIDVGRLYKLKEVMMCVNWDSPESLKLKGLLVDCFEARIFYKSTQGINFLAVVFNLHPLMLAPIDEVLKKCIMSFPETLLKPCSDMFLKAWQSSSGGMRIAMEQRVFEWMRRALFTTIKTAERVRLLLNGLHSTQRTPEINDLLSRYYGPVLMRNTKVANWEVRFNAIALLCAAFPVMPPDRTQVEFEEKLTVQFRVLKDAMEDPNESVRRCAVVGAGRILRDFWEVLTIEQIAMILDAIAMKAAKDKSSVKTRQAAIQALSLVVDNPLSHGVMNELLPGGVALNLMNDQSPIVRLKFAEFLQKISRVSTFSIPRYIDQGILLARIASDHAMGLHAMNPQSASIATVLTNIIAPSVFAVGGADDQVTRCERLAEALPQALLALTANSEDATSEIDRVRLAVALATRVTKLASSGRKIQTAKILLRAAIDLMSKTSLAGVQDTESKFAKTGMEESKKLAEFVFRYISDREMDRFVGAALESKSDLLPELMDWLAFLDRNRLPMVANTVAKATGLTKDTRLRIAKNWGFDSDKAPQNEWKELFASIRSRTGPCNGVERLVEYIESHLQLKDKEKLKEIEPELVRCVQEIFKLMPNIKFVPEVEKLLKSSLCALLMVSRGSDLAAILHPANVGVIQSLHIAPVAARSSAKRAKGRKSDQESSVEEIAMNPNEMVDLLLFYVSYLLACSLIADVPLKVVKFDEVTTVLFAWIDRADMSRTDVWNRVFALLISSTDAQASAQHAFGIIEGLAKLKTEGPDIEGFTTLVVDNFGYANELNTFITKLKLSGDHQAFLASVSDAIQRSANVPDDLRKLVSA